MAPANLGNQKLRRLKVLLSAYACEPGQGSEPGVGWNVAREMAAYHDIWVITRANNRSVIEQELAAKPVKGLRFVYFDLPQWARWWKKGNRGVQAYYYLWQLGIYPLARRLHQQVGFDLAHHVTFVKYWAPSLLAFLPVPFLWGPVGGGEAAPPLFREEFSHQGRLYEAMRDLAQWLGEHDPLVRQTARRSRFALATTRESQERMRCLGTKRAGVQGESALGNREIKELLSGPYREDGKLRFISMGRLLHWKGLHLGIRAFASAELKEAEYLIAGEGPEQHRLKRLAEKLGVTDRVFFLGKLPRKEALRHLLEASIFVHPSLHDSGGWVCLEAMAAAKPVICLALGGPEIQITEETGIKVNAFEPDQAVRDLAQAMKRLAGDRQLRIRLGSAGRKRVERDFSWSHKAGSFNEIYARLTS